MASGKKQRFKPGQDAPKNLELYVIDSKGKHLGKISVPKGNRIPPSRLENAAGYVEK